MLTPDQKHLFDTKGYLVVSGLFSDSEIKHFRQHYEAMRVEQAKERTANMQAIHTDDAADPLLEYPRIMQPHRHDETSLQWLIDPRIRDSLTHLLGREPFAVQTMFYFKPPGARGQALHQDQYYLRVQPGTCIATWMAVDDCDEENGCLRVVPGSQRLGRSMYDRGRHNREFHRRYRRHSR